MVKNHLSRLTSPVSWPNSRKGVKFILRPDAGAHSLRESMSLDLVLRSLLKYVRTAKEVRKVLHESNVVVNGKVRRDPSIPIGVMDVISVPKLKKSYRVSFTTKGKFSLVELDEKEAGVRSARILDKTLLKKGIMQVNFSDGSNIRVEKDSYKVGDTLLLSLTDGKVMEHLPLKEGAKLFITGGSQVGRVALLESIKDRQIMIKIGEESFETALRFAFVVGDLKVETE